MRSCKPDINYPVKIVHFDHQPIFVSTDVEHGPAPLQNAGTAEFLFDLCRIGPTGGLRLVEPGIQFCLCFRISLGQRVQRSSRYYSHIVAWESPQRKANVPILGKTCPAPNQLGKILGGNQFLFQRVGAPFLGGVIRRLILSKVQGSKGSVQGFRPYFCPRKVLMSSKLLSYR